LEEIVLKEIGILEVHCHAKYLYTLCKICKTKQSNVTIFTTKEIFLRLEKYLENTKEYTIILKKDIESIHAFLKRVEKICNEKIDILFVNTFQLTCFHLPKYFGFNPKSKMILTVHTANAWLKPKLVFNIKQLVRTIDTNLSSFIGHRLILPKFDGINVIYPPMKDFVLKETNYKKKIFTLPFNFYEEQIKIHKKQNKKIQFVIPGQIEEHRRDYDVILDAFEQLFKEYNKTIDLRLLGYPVGMYGNRILNRCKKLKDKGYNITYYDSFVPEETYHNIMKTVDFILLPIKIKSRGMGIQPEYYGKTKGSAAVFEGIQYAKPMVVPKDFNMIKELNGSTLKYDNSKDLETTLTEYIKNRKKLENLENEAYKNSKYFSLVSIQKYFTIELLDKLENL